MEQSNTALPSWIPWATTVVLAVLVACVAERLNIERSRNELLRGEAALTASALKSAANQIEAEQILSKRELSQLGHDFSVEVLAFREKPSKTCGAVVWNPSSPRGALVLFNLPKKPRAGDYQLWMVDQGTGKRAAPASCAVFEVSGPVASFRANLDIAAPGSDSLRFVLFYGKKGGAATLDEADSGGSIVLASPRWDGRITDP
jgi:hypothetical protein